MQPDAFADAVITLVKNALAPVQERLASAEARLAMLGDVRDRVVTLETKSATPVVFPPPVEIEPVDLSPFLERVAAAEALLKNIGDLRDRVVVMETKSTQPVDPSDVSDIVKELSFVKAELNHLRRNGDPSIAKVEDLEKELAAIRERVAVAETRQFIPGPMGRDGQPGRDGKDGSNGVDGLGWDDLNVAQVDERTFTVKCLRGLQVKDLGTLTFPVQIYRGVYVDGKTYDKGDGVTWGGSEWHCNETTNTKPGDGSKSWTLKVKRGRDGKDGSSPTALPVVRR